MKKKVIIVCNIALLFSACTSLAWKNSSKETLADKALLRMSEELVREEATGLSEKGKGEEISEQEEALSKKEEKMEFSKSENREKKEEEKKEHSSKIEVTKVVRERKILFVGDSVMKGSEAQLRKIFPNAIVDSAVSRQFSALPDILRKVEQSQGIPDVVVIHLGSNGNIFEKHMIESMKILGNRQVFFINCKVERPWQETVNTFLKNQVAKYKNTKLVDWYSLAHDQNQYFAKDRIHPNQVGAKVYRGMILEKLEKEL
ncbi:acyltransferase [Fusobacterium necrophorum BL]|uniref:Acyltransferase n=1 Tax=Fusobacterium necrophorum BL TaxID=1441732 RepID=A0AB73BWM7_9FUSO|nr:acyltransferase [Fusobacterium necrophorum]KDE63478.1 acyltransferase [Fusobacterium necrophorum BL]